MNQKLTYSPRLHIALIFALICIFGLAGSSPRAKTVAKLEVSRASKPHPTRATKKEIVPPSLLQQPNPRTANKSGTSTFTFMMQGTPSITSISPTPVPLGSFSLTINGSAFNTSNAQIVVTGPNCPTSTSCVVPNGVLTTKTGKQLAGPLMINTAGTFTIQVQNGSGPTLSNE